MNDEERKQLERLLSMASDEEFKQAAKKRKGTTKPVGRPRMTKEDVSEAVHAYFNNNKCATKASKVIVNKVKSKAKGVEVLGIRRSGFEAILTRFFPKWRKLFKIRGFDDLYFSVDRVTTKLKEDRDPVKIVNAWIDFYNDIEQGAKTAREKRRARQSKELIVYCYVLCILNDLGLGNEAEFLQEMEWLNGRMEIINPQKVDEKIKEMTDTILIGFNKRA